jgi:ferredoxin
MDIVVFLCEKYPNGLFEYDNDGNTPFMKYMQQKQRNKEIEEMLLDLMELARVTATEKEKSSIYSSTTSSFGSPLGNSSSIITTSSNATSHRSYHGRRGNRLVNRR